MVRWSPRRTCRLKEYSASDTRIVKDGGTATWALHADDTILAFD